MEIVLLSGALAASPSMILANTPTSLYRLQWVYKVLYGPFSLGATHQGNPLRLKKIIPLKTRLLYTWALPRPNGKYGRSRPISSSLSQ